MTNSKPELDPKALEAARDTIEWVAELKCHYCRDYAHDAHRCRAGSHDFRETGRKVATIGGDELTAAITAYLSELGAEPVAGWIITFADGSAGFEFLEEEADEVIDEAKPGATKRPVFHAHPAPSPATEEMVERVDRALYEENDAWSAGRPWPDLSGEEAEYRRFARAAIKAMGEKP